MIEVQDIFNQYGAEFLKDHTVSQAQLKALRDIERCRTAALGGHAGICNECGHQEVSYNSCRNRHCPKCQTIAKEQWIEKQGLNLLNTGYFHVVFTIPKELHTVMYQNQETMYKLFFTAVSQTLLELGMDSKYLGAKLGLTAVMHTWGQNLLFHPHIHCIIPGGGLTPDNKWVFSRKKFFIPVKVLSKKFRGKFMALFRQAAVQFQGAISELNIPGHFDLFISALYKKDWVVYCKPPFKNAAKVIEYLGRYTHRVAISNNRILGLKDGYVTFKWRDYKDSSKVKTMTVSVMEFIRRFLMHVLPPGFHKIRHYGILASKDKSTRIALCKKLTDTPVSDVKPRNTLEILQDRLGINFNLCPKCGVGYMTRASPAYPNCIAA